jgi:hypothetical protein
MTTSSRYSETNIQSNSIPNANGYIENKFTDKVFNETIFIPCNCSCPQCSDEIEVNVEFTSTAFQCLHEDKILFDVDIEIIEATAVNPDCQSLVYQHHTSGVWDECLTIAENFANLE